MAFRAEFGYSSLSARRVVQHEVELVPSAPGMRVPCLTPAATVVSAGNQVSPGSPCGSRSLQAIGDRGKREASRRYRR